MKIDTIIVIDILGTFAFAISGVMAAVERKFDLFGTIILAFVTAVGGGTLRDILIGQTPVGWMVSDIHVWVMLSALPLSYFFLKQLQRMRKAFLLFDTIGIGLFTILGLEVALDHGLYPVIAIMMGVVSAVFGGVMRDVLSNQVPLIFRKEIYAFACFAGALVYIELDYLSIWSELKLILSILTVIAIRLLSIRYKWSIPFKPRG
ncbi:MAG: trimeric intracellular cation channel family protein [Crocinitomicaceae bacterium]|nr:trimeric intracellular cation channel family protein [Crocinitomicaceae bacterium]